mgnify:CR=1 FL=1
MITQSLDARSEKSNKQVAVVHAINFRETSFCNPLSRICLILNSLVLISIEIKDYLDRQPRPSPPPRAADHEEEEPPLPDYDDIAALVVSDIEASAEEHALPKINKELELKKLFRRIAEQTHPDKVRANGFSEKEIARLRCIFMRAREAHDNENWYILYSIAIQLGLEIEEPTAEEIDWIEEDIKKTLAAIAAIASLSAWNWYVGDEIIKKQVLQYYFLQAYNFEHPSL